MQFLGPAENGMNEKGCLSMPGVNLSGMNASGLVQCLLDRCMK